MSAKSKKIYKYIGPEAIEKVFHSSDVVTLKCGLPKEFNDPYELFLTIDFNERPDALAFYVDTVGELPQLPTTCFSMSPIVIPMWAHYAQNLQGFALEFSQDELSKAFPKSEFGDVSYSDAPAKQLSGLLHLAYESAKYRHTYLLQRAVFSAAYYTKASCWSYEQECRMVIPPADTRQSDALTLLDAPEDCITSIICGPRAPKEMKQALIKKAEEIDCRYFELRVGKSSAIPYFIDTDGEPFSFDQEAIAPSERYCEECMEPLAVEAEQCSWCQIDDVLQENAASRNPFRLLDHLGILESYIEGMDALSGKAKK